MLERVLFLRVHNTKTEGEGEGEGEVTLGRQRKYACHVYKRKRDGGNIYAEEEKWNIFVMLRGAPVSGRENRDVEEII